MSRPGETGRKGLTAEDPPELVELGPFIPLEPARPRQEEERELLVQAAVVEVGRRVMDEVLDLIPNLGSEAVSLRRCVD